MTRPHLKRALQVGAIFLFALAIAYFMKKYSADISSVRNLSPFDLVTIGVWSFASYSTYAYAVFIIFLSLGLKNLGVVGWMRIYFASRIVNFFVMQGGNLYRLLVLKKKYGFSYTNTIGVTVFLVWINATFALLASAFFLARHEYLPPLYGLSSFAWVMLLILLFISGPLIVVVTIRLYRDASFWQQRFFRPIAGIAEFFVATVKDVRLIAPVALLSLAHFIFFAGVNFFSFRAINQPIEPAVACLFTTAFVFTRYVNIVPGNLGISELVNGLISEQVGIGFGNGLVVSGVVRVVEILMILVIGALYGKYAFFQLLARRRG